MDPGGKSPGWIVVVSDDQEAGTRPGSGVESSFGADRALLLRLKAEEARSAARAMADPDARRMMLQMAGTYARLARHVADRDTSQAQRPREVVPTHAPSRG